MSRNCIKTNLPYINIKQLLILLLYLSFLDTSAQSWSLGGGAVYGDDIENIGIHFRGYYNLPNNKVCFGPEYSNFFEKSETENGEETNKSLNEINFNIHYIIEISEHWGLYPLTGANLSFEKEEIEIDLIKQSEDTSKFGVNLGFGIHRQVGNMVLFAEYDHLFGNLSQNSFLLGVFVIFGEGIDSSHRETTY
ncbi:outer membrane beta-barrel protein [Flagellimonas sp. S3867]|uniref:outer membrane beta-barrel protein n=1 Tax=Flagellimonas sp. S3867 TaxID=2768063 RepID=UPI00168275AB|nr:outer membrane beta-barrel protein [Flagellimonas sp. S3867]